jgi:hypothetical protein
MEFRDIPPQFRPVLGALAAVIRRREPAIRERVERLRAENPGLDREALARKLIRSTRRRVAATGAASGATAIVPGLGTVIAIGTAASQGLFALEQQTELVLGIAILYGHELGDSDAQLLEALVVLGLVGGAVRLRDNLLIAGGERITLQAFRHLPEVWLGRAGNRILIRVLGRTLANRATSVAAKTIPLAVGVVAGFGFDWITATVLGRAAMRYYGRVAALRALRPPAGVVLPPAEDLGAGGA